MFCDSLLPDKTLAAANLAILPLCNISIFFSVCVHTNVCAPGAGVKVLQQKVAPSMQTPATD